MIKMLLRVKIMKQSKFINSLSSTFNHTFSYTNCRKHIVAIYNNTHFIFSKLGSHPILFNQTKLDLSSSSRVPLNVENHMKATSFIYTQPRLYPVSSWTPLEKHCAPFGLDPKLSVVRSYFHQQTLDWGLFSHCLLWGHLLSITWDMTHISPEITLEALLSICNSLMRMVKLYASSRTWMARDIQRKEYLQWEPCQFEW